MTPTAVHTASGQGITAANVSDLRATPRAAAPTMPISAQNIHAGKKAPNNSYDGAPRREQPVSAQLGTTSSSTLRAVRRVMGFEA